jgi:hypothetical protein
MKAGGQQKAAVIAQHDLEVGFGVPRLRYLKPASGEIHSADQGEQEEDGAPAEQRRDGSPDQRRERWPKRDDEVHQSQSSRRLARLVALPRH